MNNNKIIMHVCCASCACYPFEVLKKEGYKVVGYWNNPNIHGYREHKKRLMTMGYYLTTNKQMELIEDKYEPEKWFESITNYTGSQRCNECYKMRLEKTAKTAKNHNIEIFTSTLLYSKYQDHDTIKKIGDKIAESFGIKFLYRDFRHGWKEGINISKKIGLYRQQYCGCIFSERERFDVS